MSITATVENGSIKLPSDVHLPDGTQVEVMLPDDGLHWMLKYAGTIEGPTDLAAEHDHYVHGTSKRTEE